jgi:hypothetical protein
MFKWHDEVMCKDTLVKYYIDYVVVGQLGTKFYNLYQPETKKYINYVSLTKLKENYIKVKNSL